VLPGAELIGRSVGVDDAVDAVDAGGVSDDVVMAGQESVLIAAPVAENISSRKQYSSSSGSSRSLYIHPSTHSGCNSAVGFSIKM